MRVAGDVWGLSGGLGQGSLEHKLTQSMMVLYSLSVPRNGDDGDDMMLNRWMLGCFAQFFLTNL